VRRRKEGGYGKKKKGIYRVLGANRKKKRVPSRKKGPEPGKRGEEPASPHHGGNSTMNRIEKA